MYARHQEHRENQELEVRSEDRAWLEFCWELTGSASNDTFTHHVRSWLAKQHYALHLYIIIVAFNQYASSLFSHNKASRDIAQRVSSLRPSIAPPAGNVQDLRDRD